MTRNLIYTFNLALDDCVMCIFRFTHILNVHACLTLLTFKHYPPPPPSLSLSLYLFELDDISTKVKFTADKVIVHKQFLWNIKDVSDVLFAQIMEGNWS